MKTAISEAEGISTPCYCYDMELLSRTLDEINSCMEGYPYSAHYAVKANGNPEILRTVARAGFGADCVSGGEIRAAIECGFAPETISYAGVGKTDHEIRYGIEAGIGAFNVESVEELEIIAGIARECGRRARVLFRINPDIDAHTHHYITTGIAENKFGMDMRRLDDAIGTVLSSPELEFRGLHFHIGSQITTMEPFELLCQRIMELQARVEAAGLEVKVIDVGGGLGIDYEDPDAAPIADFRAYFDVFKRHLPLREGQSLCFEPGRSVVAQCGSLLTRVIYVKHGIGKKFLIVDGGMSDLLRPALYGAHHAIENLSAARRGETATEIYDVVGPICESADIFARDERMPVSRRGDLIAFRSAGAYGESMASNYNMRSLPGSVYIRGDKTCVGK